MRIHHALAVAALAAGSAVGGSLAGAADNVIRACVRTDRVFVIPIGQCKTGEQPLAWNVSGPVGPAGPAGPQGPPGPKGEPGTKLTSIDDLNGLACSSGGIGGAISVSVGLTGGVTLECSARAPSLRVNELMTGTAASATNEFVELLNAGPVAADLGGFRLVYRSSSGTSDTTLATVPAGTSLGPGARYVFGGASFSGTADQSFNVGLASTGGGVGLRSPSAQLVDSVGYGTATNAFVEGSPAAAPPPGTSISRLPDGHDGNLNSADFSVTSAPTPGAVNHP
jgi:hypothetical protein